MDWVIILAMLIMVGSTVMTVRTKSQITRALEGKTVPIDRVLEAPKPEQKHRLIRTWIVSSRDMSIPAGWRWKCSCTVWGVATNAVMNSHLGTEDEAIEGWKRHAQKYLEASRNEYKELYEKVDAEFADYRSKCYCKDANDELIQWRNQ